MSLALVMLGVLMTANAGMPEFRVEPAPQLEALFKRDSGWIGADADYSVPLDNDTTLWLFGDTFVGKVDASTSSAASTGSAGRRVDAVMINNSIAVQRLDKAGKVEFHYRTDKDGKPASFFTPTDGRGYLWPLDGIATKRGLFIVLSRIEPDAASTVFPFRAFGTSLAHIENPGDPPMQWRIAQSAIPYCRFEKGSSIYFGCSVVEDGGWLYVYGLDSLPDVSGFGEHPDVSGFRQQQAGRVRQTRNPETSAKQRPNVMVLARVKPDKIDEFGEWRFYSRGKWIEDYTKCEALAEGMTTEYNVRRIDLPPAPSSRRGGNRFVAVYTEGGIFGNIMIRLAPRPEGPWSEPVKLYECPDKSWHKRAYCYAAKVHPELSRSPEELIITYAANSMDFADLFKDARLYWPRFVRVLTFP